MLRSHPGGLCIVAHAYVLPFVPKPVTKDQIFSAVVSSFPPLHMKKELTHHDRTAVPFHEGSGPAASPPAVAAPDYTQSDTRENLPLLTCNCTSLHFAFRFDVQEGAVTGGFSVCLSVCLPACLSVSH